MQYTITLLAGVPKRQQFNGKTLLIPDIGAATALAVDVEFSGGLPVEQFRGVKQGFRLRTQDRFTSASFTSATNCTIEVIVTDADVSVNFTEGSAITATIAGLPLPVSNDRGAPGTPVYVSGITYTDAPAVTLQDNAAVAVTSSGAGLLTANASRKRARFANIGNDPVALGFTGITWAKRCIVLNPGDIWIEESAANLAWSAICDATKTASVTVQEVIA